MLPRADADAEGDHQGAPPAPERANWPGRLHRSAAALLITTIAGLELWAVLGPHEDWPFTSAPMFARYQTPGAPVFELSFYAEDPAGVRVELDPLRHLGTGELGFRRHFFARYYGSTDPRHPSGHLRSDSEAAFRQRIAGWMRLVALAYAKQQGHPPRRLWLEASKLSAGRVERRPLFEFDPRSGELRTLSRGPWAREAGGA